MSFESLRFAQSFLANSRRRGSLLSLSFPSRPRKSHRYPQRWHPRMPARSLSNPQTSLQSSGTSAGSCSLLLRRLDPATAGQAARHHTETASTSPARALRPPLPPFAPQGPPRAWPFVVGTPNSRLRSKSAPAFPKLSIVPLPPSSPPNFSANPPIPAPKEANSSSLLGRIHPCVCMANDFVTERLKRRDLPTREN